MRAKKMAKKFRFNPKDEIGSYIMVKKDFEMFIDQICKEQRELCARRAWSMQYEFDPLALGIEYDEFIRDSRQPQIFEEGRK